MIRLQLRLDDFARLGSDKRSGDWVDVDSGVYCIRRYHIASNHMIGYGPTIIGYTVYMADALIDWWTPVKAQVIYGLIDRGIGNYPPDGDYVAWSDLWRKEPVARYRPKAVSWGSIRKALGVKSWGDQ